jgi:hypothetical protein
MAKPTLRPDDGHGIRQCRWGRMTLFLPYPFWLSSESCPWSCVRDGSPRPLETTEICLTCPRWEPPIEGQPSVL